VNFPRANRVVDDLARKDVNTGGQIIHQQRRNHMAERMRLFDSRGYSPQSRALAKTWNNPR
jgi:hypothetical protein